MDWEEVKGRCKPGYCYFKWLQETGAPTLVMGGVLECTEFGNTFSLSLSPRVHTLLKGSHWGSVRRDNQDC